MTKNKIVLLRVFKNTSAYSIAHLLPFLTHFFLLPIYTRYMTPEDYGILALVLAFKSFLITSIALQLNAALPRFYFDYKGEDLQIFFSTIMYSVIGLSTLVLLLIHWFGDQLIGFVFPTTGISYYPYFFISLFTIFTSEINSVTQRMLVVQEKGGLILVRTFISTALSICLGLVLIVHYRMGPTGAILASAVGSGIIMFLNIFLVKEFFILKWKLQYFILTIKFSWPIIPHAIGGYLFMSSDKIILEKFLSLSVIGLYSVANKFSMLLKFVVNAINQALMPSFYRLAKTSEASVVKKWKDLITKWAVLISFLYLVAAFFSEEVLMIMTHASYHQAYPIIPILLLAYIFRGFYCFSSSPMFFRKATKYIPLITFSAGLFNVAGNLLLIPHLGVYGAAYTSTASFFLTFILAHIISFRFFSIEYDWVKLMMIFIPMLLVLSGIILIREYSPVIKAIVKCFLLILFAVYLWICNFSNFKNDIKILKNSFLKGFGLT